MMVEELHRKVSVMSLEHVEHLGLFGPHPHFWEFAWEDVFQAEVAVCGLILLVSGVLCAAAGIGGGGIIVTVLMFFGKLTPFDAVPLSKSVVFIGSLISLALNLPKQLSGSDGQARSLIDWGVCKAMVPMALLGTLFGVVLNHTTASWEIVLLLCVVLLGMTYTVSKKGIEQYMSESRAMEAAEASEREPLWPKDAEKAQEQAHGTLLSSNPSSPTQQQQEQPQQDNTKQSSFPDTTLTTPAARKESPQTAVAGQLDKLEGLLLFFLLMTVVVGGVIRYHAQACQEQLNGILDGTGQVSVEDLNNSGCRHPVITVIFGKAFATIVADQGYGHIFQGALIVVPLWGCLTIAMFYGHRNITEHGWDFQKVMTYQSVALATGTLSGLVGIGGGLIFSPFLLIMGVDPNVAVATSATCVIFTSSSTTMQYLLIDRIRMSLALAYALVNSIASFMGTSLVHYLGGACGRKSTITLIVASSVAISLVLAGVKLYDEIQSLQATTPEAGMVTARMVNFPSWD